MKQIFSLFVAVLLAISVTGCGDNTEKASSTEPSAQTEANNTSSSNEKEQSLGDSMKESLNDGMQGKIQAGDTVLEYGGDWPDFALLKNIPKPSAGTVATTEEVAGVMASIMLVDMSIDECREYAGLLSKAGFDENVYETSMEGVYSYSADDGDGLHVDCGYISESVVIQVSVVEK